MTIINKRLSDIKPIPKEKTDFLKKKYKTYEHINYEDIPAINFELIETGVYRMIDWSAKINESDN